MTTITRRRARAALCLALVWAAPAAAFDIPLPAGAQATRDETEAGASYRLPTGPWTEDGGVPTVRIDGRVTERAWRIGGRDFTPEQLVGPMREALRAAGWEIVLDCQSRGCGGFDFRFETRVLPAPAMYVDLTDFGFVSARGPDGQEGLSLLVSRDGATAYVQMIRATPDRIAASEPATPEGPAPARDTDADAPSAPPAGALIARLEAEGHVILDDVLFGSGEASLGDGEIASLESLATYLAANEDHRLLLVGHTDATGSLDANRALSRRRAEAAARYLRESGGVPAARVSAEGAGFLAPVASNLTEAGRERNRRVEAVLLPAP